MNQDVKYDFTADLTGTGDSMKKYVKRNSVKSFIRLTRKTILITLKQPN